VDLLTKLLHEYRPRERERGAAEAAYRKGLDAAVDAIERAGGGDALLDAMSVAADAFARVATDDSGPRPLIGMIGEVYVRLNGYANRFVIEQVEAAGGQVSLAGFAEWQYFSHWHLIDTRRMKRQYREVLKAYVTQAWMRVHEHKLHDRVAHVLQEGREPRAARLARGVRRYYDPSLGGEIVPTLARAIEYAHEGACGILNVLPFSCMPGILSSAMAPRLRADLDWIPWLDLSFDGQETTNIRTRLEAFMHQALQFQRRRGPSADRCPQSSANDATIVAGGYRAASSLPVLRHRAARRSRMRERQSL
jgi:predicted nucleotide-binding protein (sugar kinase/HSP70/actin superfamily)